VSTVIPVTDLKINPGKIIRHVQESHRPVVLTRRGRGVAVVQSLSDFEDQAGQRIFMKGVLAGMIDIEEGREISLEDVKNRLKII
jgi:prevent-host-death family protein